MAAHSSVLAWRIPWTEDLAGPIPWGRKESDITEAIQHIPSGLQTVIQVYAPTSNAKKLKLNGSMKTYKTF